MEVKILLGIIATALGFVGYYFYIRDIIRGRTKPHAFSWLVWGTLSGIGFAAQITDGGGAGSWATGAGSFTAICLFFVALKWGEKNITKIDWLSLVGSAFALIIWIFTDEPLVSIALISIIDASGFIPTFRKSYLKPQQETLSQYILAGVKHAIGLTALSTFTLLTVPYVLSLMVMNFVFVGFLIWRRKAIKT